MRCALPLLLLLAAPASASGPIADGLRASLAALDPGPAPSGILYDRVLGFSGIERYHGGPAAAPVELSDWRQLHHELLRAADGGLEWPSPEDARAAARAGGAIPIAVIDARYDRLSPQGVLEPGSAFAVTALRDRTHRGATVRFTLDPAWYLTNGTQRARRIAIDFDDGRGFRSFRPGARPEVVWKDTGTKHVRVRAELADGSRRYSGFSFHVRALGTPAPDDTLAVNASIPYDGVSGTGEAYVYLADAHTELTKPVIVIEGFDLEDSYYWEELYELLNQENLIETLRADGFDAVVLNFTSATDPLQRNSYVVVELIQQVRALLGGPANLVVVGASMGGLCTRYALAYMEQQALPHDVSTFISFDAPHRGASIPLGVQHWVDFFAGESADAAFLLSRLDTAGARQMLVYHHTVSGGPGAAADPLRADFLADLAAVGGWPSLPRKVAVANGSATTSDQGFGPGAQVVDWEYSSFLVDVIGNVWAVGDGANQLVFHGLLDPIFVPAVEELVTLSGTAPYDNAPGGFRASMAEMDSTPAPFGDIVALHDAHCFIPTISALDLSVSDLFHDVAGDPDLLSLTPFDAVYFPTTAPNQEHVAINAENAEWLLSEIRAGAATGVEPVGPASSLELLPAAPNPFSSGTSIRFRAGAAGPVRIAVYDVTGRLVRRLLDEPLGPGLHAVDWDGRGGNGLLVPDGVYFYRLRTGSGDAVGRVLLLR